MSASYSPSLYNEDMAPTPQEQRTWTAFHIASLWIGMAVCVPTYMLAGSLIQQGLNWWESILVILVGNLVVLVPMILNGHAGTAYGIPFPVLLRASYGHKGAHIPSLLRALVACGWFGIQTWIGGVALHTMTLNLVPGYWTDDFAHTFVMYLIFWLMNMYFVWNGTESIKTLETWSAPFLIGIGLVLLGWGVSNGGGLGATLDRSYELARPVVVAERTDGARVKLKLRALLDLEGKPKAKAMLLGEVVPGPDGAPVKKPLTTWIPFVPEYDLATTAARVYAQFDSEAVDTDKRSSSAIEAAVAAAGTPAVPAGTDRWKIYLLGLTAMVGFWATLALNIPDITRLAKSQRDQALGQSVGLPLTMGLYSFIGLAVTCATLNIFPDLVVGQDAIWDPVALLSRFDNPLVTVIAMIMLAVATLTTNIAANVISPANSFAAAFPDKISARTGGVLAACLGILMMPWKLLDMYLGWLIGYSGLLGPVIGVMVVDYYLVRKTELDVDALYTEGSAYAYQGGFNLVALLATGLGVATVVLGWMVPALGFLAEGAWFSAAIVAGAVYFALQPRPRAG